MHADRTKRLPENQEAITVGQDDARDEGAAGEAKSSGAIAVQIWSRKPCTGWKHEEGSSVVNSIKRWAIVNRAAESESEYVARDQIPAGYERPIEVPAQ